MITNKHQLIAGVLRWYRGVGAELIGIVPKSSGMYAGYEITRRILDEDYGYGDTNLVATVAGFISGIPEALIVTPTQVVKVRLQAKEHLGRYHNSLHCLSKIIQKEGVSVMYTGIGPTLWRNCVFNTVYFSFIHSMKSFLPKPKSIMIDLCQTLIAGFLGGIIGTCFNIPFDVVKSRFQSQVYHNNTPVRYRSTLQSLYLISKEEGIASCYKGLHAKCYRMAIGGSTAMVVFEAIQIFTNYKKL